MWIVTIVLLASMPVLHGLGHYLAAGRPGRLAHAVIPFYHCAGCGLFHDLPRGRRVAGLFAGLGVHYVALSAVALAMYLAWGVPTGNAQYVIAHVEEGTDAQAKLRPGDRVLSAGGHRMILGKDAGPSLLDIVRTSGGAPIAMVIERDGVEHSLSVAPFDSEFGHRLGIAFVFESDAEQGTTRAITGALAYPARKSDEIVRGLYEVLAGQAEQELTGPVGIVQSVRLAEHPRQAVEVGLVLAVYQALLFVLVDLVLLGFAIARSRT